MRVLTAVLLQAAKILGVKELRSVVRWLENFPHSAEIVKRALDVLDMWSCDNEENADKIIKDGHVKVLCRVFCILDFSSKQFQTLVKIFQRLVKSTVAVSTMLSNEVP
jgi:hypothetical protein